MTRVAIREVVDVTGGGTPRKSVPEYYGGGVPWVTPKDMKRPKIGESDVTLTEEGVRNSPAKLIPEASVLVVVRSGVLKHTLPVALTTRPVTVNQDMKAFTPRSSLDAAYLARMIKAIQPTVLSWVRATTADNFPIDNLLDLEVELPPLPEQRRIAAILDHADALRAKRRQVLTHLDALTQSIFNDMFLRESYPTVLVQDIARVKGGKRLPKGAEYADRPTSHPYIRVTDLRGGVIQTSNLRFLTSEVQRRISRYTVDEDDVVISIAGSIGLTAAVPSVLAGANLTENAAKIVPKEHQAYSGSWLSHALQTRSLQDQIAGKVGQVTIGKLALFRIEQLELPLPPLSLQEEFVARAAKIDALRAGTQHIARAEGELFASLQSRAFRGEL